MRHARLQPRSHLTQGRPSPAPRSAEQHPQAKHVRPERPDHPRPGQAVGSGAGPGLPGNGAPTADSSCGCFVSWTRPPRHPAPPSPFSKLFLIPAQPGPVSSPAPSPRGAQCGPGSPELPSRPRQPLLSLEVSLPASRPRTTQARKARSQARSCLCWPRWATPLRLGGAGDDLSFPPPPPLGAGLKPGHPTVGH